MFNFLTAVADTANSIGLFFGSGGGSLNWLAKVIRWIIELVGNVGVGIIVFTIVLKLITLPLDIYSKSSMRKNSLKMEKMRPQLEKLQKQYQNDQQTYNMKMMELYKKNGYSMFGACLPMIVTLVIFIFVLNAFSSYSDFTNVSVYNKTAEAYSVAVIEEYAPAPIHDDEYKYEFDEPTEENGLEQGEPKTYVYNYTTSEDGTTFIVTKTVTCSAEGSFIEYVLTYTVETKDAEKRDALLAGERWDEQRPSSSTAYYYVQTDRVNAPLLTLAESGKTPVEKIEGGETGETGQDGQALYSWTKTISYGSETDAVSYRIVYTVETTESDQNAVDWNGENVQRNGYFAVNEEQFETALAGSTALSEEEKAQAEALADILLSAENLTDKQVAEYYVREAGRVAAADYYEENKIGFLWVKNIWQPDVSYKHPVQRESGVDRTTYNEITANLGYYKSAPNGYYILIVVSIGTMFLSQFILSRSQKAQNELQTADGRGQKTQKVMMIVMPIIFGVFSFFYSASFSIYMITSNIYGILSTLAINFVIDRKFRKIEEKEIQEKYNKRIPQAVRKTPDDNKRNGGKKK